MQWHPAEAYCRVLTHEKVLYSYYQAFRLKGNNENLLQAYLSII